MDKGQALANDDLSNQFPKLTVCLFVFEKRVANYEVVVIDKFIYVVYNLIHNTLDSKISVSGLNSFKKNHYLCGRFRDNKNEMQQNRMNITPTNMCRGSKRFDGVLCAPISSIVSFDIIGKTIQLKHTRTRML